MSVVGGTYQVNESEMYIGAKPFQALKANSKILTGNKRRVDVFMLLCISDEFSCSVLIELEVTEEPRLMLGFHQTISMVPD